MRSVTNKNNPKLNRQERRLQRKLAKQKAQQYGDKLHPVPHDEWPQVSPMPSQVFLSKDYLCEWEGFHATIWVDVNGYLLNDPAKLKDAIRKVMATGDDVYNF